MRLDRLANSRKTEAAEQQLKSGAPLVIRFDEALSGSEVGIKGFLLVDAFGTKAETRVTVMQSAGFSGKHNLAAAVSGTDRIPALVKGDIIAFDSAYVEGGVAKAGQVTARTHDGLRGQVQVFTAMAMASQSRVSKRGASQSLFVADGKAAVLAKSYEDVEKAYQAVKAREWPGGAAGFIIRAKDGGTGDFFEEKDAGIDFLVSELRNDDAFSRRDDVLELIPAWRLPMGREQVVRDVDPRQETNGPISGPVTRQFEHPKTGRLGYVPCLVVACDEDEWAFGGRTGKTVRVAYSVQPVFRREPVPANKLPSSLRTCGGNVNTVLTLYDAATMDAMAKARSERRGPDPDEDREELQEEPRRPLPKFSFGRR